MSGTLTHDSNTPQSAFGQCHWPAALATAELFVASRTVFFAADSILSNLQAYVSAWLKRISFCCAALARPALELSFPALALAFCKGQLSASPQPVENCDSARM